jgi:hypothetical protein
MTMNLLGPLVLAGVITMIVLAVQRRARHDHTAPTASHSFGVAETSRPAKLSDTLSRWVGDGLLSDDQARAILEHERSGDTSAAPEHAATERAAKAQTPQRRIPLYAEALGYLGGVLTLAGLTLLVANYWPDMATSARLTLSLVTTVALVGAGEFVHEAIDPALARLRSFLWMLSSATAAVFTGVLLVDGLGVDTRLLVVAGCSATIAVTSGLFWWWHDRPVQELLCVVASIVSAAAFVGLATNSGVAGLTTWLLAAVVLAAGLRGITPQPIIPHVVGAIAIIVGALITSSEWTGAGLLLVTATIGGLLLLAALPQLTMDVSKRVVLIAVATIAALQGIPMTLSYFAGEAGGVTGLVTWAIGGVMMAVGARRLLRAPIVAEVIGGLGLIGGAALTGTEWPNFAPLFGLATALVLLAIGTRPGRVLYSLLGSLGLLINVPWAIGRFFPGEGRAPLLILVSGLLIVIVAVLLARQGDRMRTELTLHGSESSTTSSVEAAELEHTLTG